MAKLSKKQKANPIDPEKLHGVDEAIAIARAGATSTFDETIEVALNLGVDPRQLKDEYADYWQQNRNHVLINRKHCLLNPKNYKGYGENCWGLTASDNRTGYAAHSPTEDLGVITPTAALASFPYTPEYSMKALRHFYDDLGNKIWSPYGFTDAFNQTENWYGTSHLAIDQGPIIVMIENYRSGLLWKLFMGIEEIQQGLKKLGFESPYLK